MSTTPAVAVAADQHDERLMRYAGVRGALTAMLDRIRGGDLGPLPVIAGLIVIWTVFQVLNQGFLSATNLSNLLMQSAALGVIALGVVLVLLLGQIDLSVGSVSGLAGAVVATLLVQQQWPVALAILSAVSVGAAAGGLYSIIFIKFGVPSFVITLAGMLGFMGLQLLVLGTSGSINLGSVNDSFLVWFGQAAFAPSWVAYFLSLAAALLFLTSRLRVRAKRLSAGLSGTSTGVIIIQTVALTLVLLLPCWYLYRDSRGIGWMFIFFLALVLGLQYALLRTRWGRSIYAIGGSREAARRAGINVKLVVTSAFVLCSALAATGGLLAASRLATAAQSAGTGGVELNAIAAAVIGGASLYGGRGSAYSALLGVLVIQSISNGLQLLSLESSWRFMITGVVLLGAVILDAGARRSRLRHGRE